MFIVEAFPPRAQVRFIIADVKTTVVPSEDAHSSEYICAADARRGPSILCSCGTLGVVPDTYQLSSVTSPDLLAMQLLPRKRQPFQPMAVILTKRNTN